MANETIKVPDLGGADDVEVIEISVSPGDTVETEDSLIVLESDKASMEVPSPKAGKVVEIKLKEGDSVAEGDAILVLDVADGGQGDEQESAQPDEEPEDERASQQSGERVEKEEKKAEDGTGAGKERKAAKSLAGETSVETIKVPDIGGADDVTVIEISVGEGDEVAEGDSLIALESDKASMDVPSPKSGRVKRILLKEGDDVKEGTSIVEMEVVAEDIAEAEQPAEETAPENEEAEAEPPKRQPDAAEAEPESASGKAEPPSEVSVPDITSGESVYAGPAVRKLAREFSIDLAAVKGSGPKGRILKEDLQQYVKQLVDRSEGSPAAAGGIPSLPEVDFSRFGDVDVQPLTRLNKLTASNMHRSWLNLPHVTQFDDVDITDLETFRQALKDEAKQRDVKITPLPFLLKACAAALREHPDFNASLHSDGEHIVYKQYVHIGIAVDTPVGLMVPVIRDVDRKSVWDLAAESAELAQKAKERKLKPEEMQGGCFTISSLGNIGGTGFTPIINAPELAILGVSKAEVRPRWNGSDFEPRTMLPLSLSYDHRAINGADAGRFLTDLGELLADIRRLVL